jgi:threonine dehydrogenase-like Zn-dependent dehydrogenase
MRALCWKGVNELATEYVPDPDIVSPTDAIVRVRLSSVCGSDLHLLNGHMPTMRPGDIIGHEFVGEVIAVGPEVKRVAVGNRVVVPSIIACGKCHYCERGEVSLCDNANPNERFLDAAWGSCIGGVYGSSHALGGYAGSHAEFVRVPFADHDAIPIPDGMSDESALFVSDAAPTGYMAAEMCDIRPGDVVAVWGCGAVGLMAIHSAFLLGAERVIAIDRLPERLRLAESMAGAEVLNYELVDVFEALKELTGGRGPDACIDAVGMEAHETGIEYVYDRLKQGLYLEGERASVLRQAIYSCRKGGVVSVVGVYGSLVDKFPIGAAMNKALRLRMGQQFGQKYAPTLLKHIQDGKLNPSYLITHRYSLEEGPRGYEIFKNKREGCLRVVFDPEKAAPLH